MPSGIAKVLDVVLLVFFGAWAYLVARKKNRDEVGWAIVAAVAFFVPGYIVQEAVFPALMKSYGWGEAVKESWQKPSGFLVGGLCSLVVCLVVTFFRPPLPAPEKREGEGDGPPSGGKEGGGDEGSGGGAEEQPEGQAEGGGAPDAGGAEPPVEQQMAVATPGGAAVGVLDPQALARRFWPVAIPLAAFVLVLIPAMGQATFGPPPENPADDPRYFLLPLVLGVFFWRLRGRPVEGVIAALFTLMYVPAIAWMQWRWGRGSSYYSHGYLIPVVVGWLIWQQRGRLAKLGARDDLRVLGLAVLLGGLAMLVGGTFLRTYSVQGVSFVVVLCGTLFFLCGRAVSKALLFPLAFTVTMIPLPMHMVERLTFKLKMFATMFSVWTMDLLRAVGLHNYLVVQDGSYIRWEASPPVLEKLRALSAEMAAAGAGAEEMEAVHKVLDTGMDKIIIGDVCSGLRSLIALLAFGALFAYLSKMSMARRLLLFAAAVPISVLANMWRIVTLAFIACALGSHATHGWVHDFTGYGIFAVAFVLFFGFERVLRAFEPKEGGGASPAAGTAAQAAKPA